MGVGLRFVTLLPCVVGSCQTTGVGDVFSQSETPVDMERLRLLARHGKLRILVHKALRTLLEGLDRLFIPPVGVVSSLIIMSACRIECCNGRVSKEKSPSTLHI